MIIRDPVTGVGATINPQQEMLVKAISATIEHTVSSRDGQSFVANTTDTADTLTLADGNTYKMLYLENLSSTKQLVIQKISMSASAAGLVAAFIRNPVLGVIADQNVHVPVNNKFSSGNAPDVLCYNWDETGTVGLSGITGGVKIQTHILGSGETDEGINGSIVLDQGNALMVSLTNGTGSPIEAEVGVRFYFDRPAE